MAPKGNRIAAYNPSPANEEGNSTSAVGALFQLPELKAHNTVGKKLAEARRHMHMSQKEMSAALELYGTSVTAGAISKWEKGDAFPSALQLLAVCAICHIDNISEYFLGQTIEAADYSPELNQEGLHILQTMKDALVASGHFTPPTRRKAADAATAGMKYMPVCDDLASAASGGVLDESSFTPTQFPASHIPDGADFGVRMPDDSMEPVYIARQIVWVQKCSELARGEVGLFICGGKPFIRQYEEGAPTAKEYGYYIQSGAPNPLVSLVAFKNNYLPQVIIAQSGFAVVGRVLN